MCLVSHAFSLTLSCFQVDHAIAAFLIRALDLVGTFAAECNTACKLSNAQLSNQDITDMARIASRELLVADSPFLCTVRMQVTRRPFGVALQSAASIPPPWQAFPSDIAQGAHSRRASQALSQVGMEQTFRAEKALVEAEVIERDNQLDSVLQTITGALLPSLLPPWSGSSTPFPTAPYHTPLTPPSCVAPTLLATPAP